MSIDLPKTRLYNLRHNDIKKASNASTHLMQQWITR